MSGVELSLVILAFFTGGGFAVITFIFERLLKRLARLENFLINHGIEF